MGQNDGQNVEQVGKRVIGLVPIEFVLPDKFSYTLKSNGKVFHLYMEEDVSDRSDELVDNTIEFCKKMYKVTPELKNGKLYIVMSGGAEVLGGLLFEMCIRLQYERTLRSTLSLIERTLLFEDE